MTDIVFRNGNWTYGKWGGLGWSGGEATKPGQRINRAVDPEDTLDGVFKDHDIAYEDFQTAYEASAKTMKDCANYWIAKIAADKALLTSINTLTNNIGQPGGLPADFRPFGAVSAAVDATIAFVPVLAWDIAGLASCVDPDTSSGPPISFGPPPNISSNVSTDFNNGMNWFRRSDPLILDLDGDGIELTTSSASVLFDHNADNLKTGSQWAKSDDGILVRDLDGNGTIDSGRELFGDNTRLQNGSLAANGFAALADLDRDAAGVADGVFNTSDTAYTGLRIWRDLNQDGISQTHELQTLLDAGVSSIHLVANAQGVGSFVKSTSTATGSIAHSRKPTKATPRHCKSRFSARKNRLINNQNSYVFSSVQC